MKKNKLVIGALALALLSSCSGFERINTDEFGMTPEEGKRDGVAMGANITTLQSRVTPVGTQADATDIINQYQIAYQLGADTWSGFFGQNNNWNSGSNNTTYFLINDWVSAFYRNSYDNIIPTWKTAKLEAEKANMPEVFALAQILKISAWHKATDTFGPIPYTSVGKTMITIPYDSQEEVYKAFFEDLSNAIELLTDKAEQNIRLLPAYDAIYAGNVNQWVKYANSLMLRLAIRVRYVDPQLAKEYAEKAISHPIGIMMDVLDEAKIGKGANVQFINNIETLANQYGESRMGSSIFSYLAGYEDPRLPVYFKTSTSPSAVEVGTLGKYQAIPTGNTLTNNEPFKELSMPNFDRYTPTYWMRASEIYFLRAEGALIGWNMNGSAEDLYKEGVRMSFKENGIDVSIAERYLNSEKIPTKYELKMSEPFVNVSVQAPSEVTPKWGGNQEQQLEKIITQKWLALYPNGQEAWTEWRRTGYPKLHEVQTNRSGGEVSSSKGIRRMRYPNYSTQSEADKANMAKAIELLGGADLASTNVWWDKKN